MWAYKMLNGVESKSITAPVTEHAGKN